MRIRQTAAWSIPVLTFTLAGLYAEHSLRTTPAETAHMLSPTDASNTADAANEVATNPHNVITTRSVSAAPINPISYLPAVSLDAIDEETLWLARCIFSESKRPTEQELVAWVVRNRVETGYRKKTTYQDTVLDPYQFSAFNTNYPRRAFYTSLDAHSDIPGWKTALQIAHYVRHARSETRPFPRTTRHFYSERSLPDSVQHPAWAAGREPVEFNRDYEIEAERFRFFAGVS